ncbi:transposase DDE domain protein [Roseovarius sp. A-2]|uniref:IS5 family transposase n=1 Tax=Roseovarius sp. A-2 TaxID=1570360 RepID=UPI0009B542DB|nr:IS5 family transposase [Roseovarius sp. A-2]GAW36904.1 transposase DDE domain protein [Roseovarius sp. A-2]
MPHKFNADRRDKIPKQKHRVNNWTEYNEGLRRRGDLTVWISEEALALWSAPPRTTPGGQPVYSDLAIELCLTFGMVFKQPLRQTQGLMRSIAGLLGMDIAVPDFSTLSRRGNGLSLSARTASKSPKPLKLVVDSTGLKIFGEGEWLEEKHQTKRNRRSWRKLHLGLDLVSGQIVCSDLTRDDVGDPTALPGLLDQVDGPLDLFLADGAYDGERTYVVLTARFGSMIKVTIPPPKNAILSPDTARNPGIRDRHIADIRTHGRMAWQKASGYNQRSRGETLMGRWKTVIGPKLKARSFENQKTEARIGVRILNRMTELGRPNFERTA